MSLNQPEWASTFAEFMLYGLLFLALYVIFTLMTALTED